MTRRIIQYSFAGGEVTPELFGRVDLDKRQIGLEQVQNMLVLAHGPLTRRPGAKYVAEQRYAGGGDKIKLVPFSLPDSTWCVLAIGSPQGAYVYYDSAPVLEATKTVTGASFGTTTTLTIPSHGYSNGNIIRIFADSKYKKLVFRDVRITVLDSNTIQLFRLHNNAPLDTTGTPAFSDGILVNRFFAISGLSSYTSAQLATLEYTQYGNTMLFAHSGVPLKKLVYTSLTSWAVSDMAFTIPTNAPTGVTVTAVNTQGTTHGKTDYYGVTTVTENGIVESVLSATASAFNRLDLAGARNDVSWNAVTGAERYYVYKYNGGIYAYIGQSSGTSFSDYNVTPDATKTPPILTNPVNTGAGDYPSAALLYEQRLWLAGMLNKQSTIIATRTGTDTNVSASLPTQDDDSIQLTLSSATQGGIQHLVQAADLLLFTTDGVWRLYSDADAGLTPSTVRAKLQTYISANKESKPLPAGNSILYVRRNSSRFIELTYSWEDNGYVANDISLLVPHMFNFHAFADITAAIDGETFVWLLRDDGRLLSLTFVPDQKVYAWHQHVMADGGIVESVVAIPEGTGGAVLYLSVLRQRDGVYQRTIERIRSRYVQNPVDHFYVDTGYTYDGSPTTAVYGLHALEGKTVTVVADGKVHPPVTVVDGAITLQFAASVVHVGLDPVTRAKTLPVIDAVPASFQGTAKNVSKVSFRVVDTNAVFVGPDFDHLDNPPMRPISTPLGTPTPLQSAEFEVFIPADWGNDGAVCIQAAPGLPLTLTSMVLDVEEGG